MCAMGMTSWPALEKGAAAALVSRIPDGVSETAPC
jgi:hypothetical protein